MSEGEAYYMTLFSFAFLWVVVSALMLFVSAYYERNRSLAWFWAGWFVASSLSAVYFVEVLVLGGGAT